MSKSDIGYTPVKGYVASPDGTESWLLNSVANVGPVVVSITVCESIFSYSNGVYYDSECSRTSPNFLGGHAIVAVGYGTDSSLGDYWIVRNSWGPDWGEQGYIRMARNKNNMCEIALRAAYPTV